MSLRSKLRALRCTICGLLLAAGTAAFDAAADPVWMEHKPEAAGAPHEAALTGQLGPAEKSATAEWLPPVFELGEIRFDNGTFAPGWGEAAAHGASASFTDDHNDSAVNRSNVFLIDLFGGQPEGANRPQRARREGPQEPTLGDVLLRMARETILDHNDSASVSVAGVDVNLNLKGERLLHVNGYEVSLSGGDATRGAAPGQPDEEAAAETALTRVNYAEPLMPFTFAEIRELIAHPLAILVALTCLALWLFAKVLINVERRLAVQPGRRSRRGRRR